MSFINKYGWRIIAGMYVASTQYWLHKTGGLVDHSNRLVRDSVVLVKDAYEMIDHAHETKLETDWMVEVTNKLNRDALERANEAHARIDKLQRK